MSRLILLAGERFGRFAVLIFAFPLFIPLLIWRSELVAERVRHFDGEWTSRVADHLDR
ncbi:hypothetical protein RFM26_01140 [Mesorhizobium sp. VK23B]|uniref:Uncharacterized protein n=1 Tax=Mesorhizobium dulcispinae TaxID=3072316 RepID=A0ABU4X7A2_9HYPH|nr:MULTISPECIES: hypothetical protein [unclassified Mesorhizobium]MDX8464295.1 hypothetical protein [Mesorhizobium sp. VK23B]MDX8470681.1 hypothetical protein [Mesorhizobium sp. VK23A]MDX8517812.1 hypothetical protein [Mesorhizobium sp. VK23D]